MFEHPGSSSEDRCSRTFLQPGAWEPPQASGGLEGLWGRPGTCGDPLGTSGAFGRGTDEPGGSNIRTS
eukprot:232411-Pyramimonas_sp.AAC.1